MTFKLQMLIIGMSLVSCFFIFRQIKRKRLDLRYVCSWIVLCIIIVILALQPGLLEMLANLTGIATPVNMLFFFGFCLGMGIIFTLSVAISHLNENVKRLAQELAIVREQVYDYTKTKGEKQSNETT